MNPSCVDGATVAMLKARDDDRDELRRRVQLLERQLVRARAGETFYRNECARLRAAGSVDVNAALDDLHERMKASLSLLRELNRRIAPKVTA